MQKGGIVYILTNKNKTALYTGVTSDIMIRIQEHRSNKYARSFSSRYNLYYLIYIESFGSIEEAITREKYIKGKSRRWKEDLIYKQNPNWDDMTTEVLSW